MAKYHIQLDPDGEKIATRKSFGESLAKLGGKYKNIVAVDGDLSGSVQTAKFGKEYPDRSFNMGVAEQNMVGAAAGLATSGKMPFVASFAVFMTGRPWEVIRNSVCYPNLNVKIVGSHAGMLTAEDGATHQALEDVAITRVLPNMKVLCPADHHEAVSMMEKMCEDFGPTYLRVIRAGTPVIYSGSGADGGETAVDFEFGKADVLFDNAGEGGKADLCVFASGPLVASSLLAAQRLEEDGKKVIVVNVSCIKPIDKETILECAGRAAMCVTAEDHSVIGGLGGAVSEIFAEEGLGVKLAKIGMPDCFGESGKGEDLYKKYGFDAEGVYETLKEL